MFCGGRFLKTTINKKGGKYALEKITRSSRRRHRAHGEKNWITAKVYPVLDTGKNYLKP